MICLPACGKERPKASSALVDVADEDASAVTRQTLRDRETDAAGARGMSETKGVGAECSAVFFSFKPCAFTRQLYGGCAPVGVLIHLNHTAAAFIFREEDMRKDHSIPRGTLHRLTLDSFVLKGNLLGDPTERDIHVYVPAGHDGKGLPLLVDLVGFTAGGPGHTNWKNFSENVPERLDRLIATGAMPPCVVAFPDCFTKLGGNQYINSAAMGRWDDFLREEAVPFVEEKFGCGGTGKRGCFGKSSGGYGAFVHAMLHPDFWAAAASHSGDIGFELCLPAGVSAHPTGARQAGGFNPEVDRRLLGGAEAEG